jgi:phage terminase small subunit
MTPKQQAFILEYLVDLCGAKAAVRAGYAPKQAKKTAHELMQKPAIQEAIAKAMRNRSQRTEITQDRVLQEVARIAFLDPRKLLRDDGTPRLMSELDDDTAAALVGLDITEEYGPGAEGGREKIGYTKKMKLADKVGALGLAMRHLGMLNDKLQLSGGVQVIVKDYTGRKPNAND